MTGQRTQTQQRSPFEDYLVDVELVQELGNLNNDDERIAAQRERSASGSSSSSSGASSIGRTARRPRGCHARGRHNNGQRSKRERNAKNGEMEGEVSTTTTMETTTTTSDCAAITSSLDGQAHSNANMPSLSNNQETHPSILQLQESLAAMLVSFLSKSCSNILQSDPTETIYTDRLSDPISEQAATMRLLQTLRDDPQSGQVSSVHAASDLRRSRRQSKRQSLIQQLRQSYTRHARGTSLTIMDDERFQYLPTRRTDYEESSSPSSERLDRRGIISPRRRRSYARQSLYAETHAVRSVSPIVLRENAANALYTSSREDNNAPARSLPSPLRQPHLQAQAQQWTLSTRLTLRGQFLCFGLVSCLVAFPHLAAFPSLPNLPFTLPSHLSSTLSDARTPLGIVCAGLAAFWAASPKHSLLKPESSTVISTCTQAESGNPTRTAESIEELLSRLLESLRSYLDSLDKLDAVIERVLARLDKAAQASMHGDYTYLANAHQSHELHQAMLMHLDALRAEMEEAVQSIQASPQTADAINAEERERLQNMYAAPVKAARNPVTPVDIEDVQAASAYRYSDATYANPHHDASPIPGSPAWRDERDRQRRSWAASPASSPVFGQRPARPHSIINYRSAETQTRAALSLPATIASKQRGQHDGNAVSESGGCNTLEDSIKIDKKHLSAEAITSLPPSLRRAHSVPSAEPTKPYPITRRSLLPSPTVTARECEVQTPRASRLSRPLPPNVDALPMSNGKSDIKKTPSAVGVNEAGNLVDPVPSSPSTSARVVAANKRRSVASPSTLSTPHRRDHITSRPTSLLLQSPNLRSPFTPQRLSERDRHRQYAAQKLEAGNFAASPLLPPASARGMTSLLPSRLLRQHIARMLHGRNALLCLVLAIRPVDTSTEAFKSNTTSLHGTALGSMIKLLLGSVSHLQAACTETRHRLESALQERDQSASLANQVSVQSPHTGGLRITLPGTYPDFRLDDSPTTLQRPLMRSTRSAYQSTKRISGSPLSAHSEYAEEQNFAPRETVSQADQESRNAYMTASARSISALQSVISKIREQQHCVDALLASRAHREDNAVTSHLEASINTATADTRQMLAEFQAQWHAASVSSRQIVPSKSLPAVEGSDSNTPDLSLSVGTSCSAASEPLRFRKSLSSSTSSDEVDTPPVLSPDLRRESQNDIHQLLLEQTNPQHLPPAGLEELLFESTMQDEARITNASALAKQKLSRDDRIALMKKRRTTTIYGKPQTEASLEQTQAMADRDLVDELKGVITLLKWA